MQHRTPCTITNHSRYPFSLPLPGVLYLSPPWPNTHQPYTCAHRYPLLTGSTTYPPFSLNPIGPVRTLSQPPQTARLTVILCQAASPMKVSRWVCKRNAIIHETHYITDLGHLGANIEQSMTSLCRHRSQALPCLSDCVAKSASNGGLHTQLQHPSVAFC